MKYVAAFAIALCLSIAVVFLLTSSGTKESSSIPGTGIPGTNVPSASEPSETAPEDTAAENTGVSATSSIAEIKMSAREEAVPGETVAVSFTANHPFAEVSVTLRSPTGKAVARTVSFATDGGNPPWSHVALIPISIFLEKGSYAIEATIDGDLAGESEKAHLTMTLTVGAHKFITEKIHLNSTNSAIKQDMSPARIAQINELNDILFSRNTNAPAYPGPYRAPLEAKRRTSQFADRRVYVYAKGNTATSLHYGIDFGVPTGTPVFASGDGKIVFSGNRISTGFTIAIEHAPGTFSLYYHLDAILAAKGESVRAGTLIGRSGSTGLSTGPHLHWEFRVNGEAVSPDWIVAKGLY